VSNAPKGRPNGKAGYQTIECSGWDDFAHTQLWAKIRDSGYCYGDWIFRGQACSSWGLRPAIHRIFERPLGLDRLSQLAISSIAEFQDRLLSAGYNPSFVEDGLAIQALAQHFGIPTTLLDWSFSPFVAAYFSLCDETVETDRTTIWALNVRNELVLPASKDDGAYGRLLMLRPPTYANDRLRNQDGCFTLLRSEKPSVEDYLASVVSCEDESPLLRFDLPVCDRREALAELEFMNVKHDLLFPGVEQLARRIREKMEATANGGI